MCFFPFPAAYAASPRIATLLLSVAPLVKITSSRLALTTAATASRADSTALFALAPNSWVRLAAFPYSTDKKCLTVSRTAGSRGVVALQSRYTETLIA